MDAMGWTFLDAFTAGCTLAVIDLRQKICHFDRIKFTASLAFFASNTPVGTSGTGEFTILFTGAFNNDRLP